MTQFNATVTERVNVFGLGPSDKWNEYNWNAFKWGYGTNGIPTVIGTIVSATATITPTAPLAPGLQIAESESATGGVGLAPAINISESESPTSGLEHVNKLDVTGDYYVFPDRTTDGEAAATPTWVRGSRSTPTWTSAVVSATSWS